MNIFEQMKRAVSKGSNPNEVPLEPLKDQNEQAPDERKIVEYVKKKLDLVRQSNSRVSLEGIYFTNVAYLMGFDGVYYDTTYKQFKNVDPKRRMSRNRFKVNKILPTIQNRLARLTKSPPRYDVRPNSNESEDKEAARLGLEIINDILEKQHFTEKRQDLHMSAMQGGTAYAQVLWDPTLGEPMVDPETEKVVGFQGDIRIDILNILEVYPDPLAKSLDDARWVIKAKVRKLDYFRDQYPERGGAVKEESAWLTSSIYDLKANALTSVGISGASTTEQQTNSAIEVVYYEKRSKDYPRGRKIVTANGVLLEDKELPVGEFDIVKFDDILIGGRYNAEGVITHLRPIQDQYNVTRTKMADWVRKMLAGKYLAAKGAGLGQEAINNDSGEVVEYNPVPNAPPPVPMQIPQIPQYAYTEIQELSGEFDFVSGINEISRGVLPSASIPASGMEILQEQDETRIGVEATRNEIGYSKLGSLILKYAGEYYQMPRLLKIAGDGLGYTVKSFVGSQLRGNYDVCVIPSSTIPTSKVMKRKDILSIYQLGLMGNPTDPKVQAKVLKMLEYGDANEMWKTQALDEAQVKKTLEAIENNVPPPLEEMDNHQMFITEMNDYRKEDKYSKLSESQKGVFKFVLEWHIQALMKLMNPQVIQQQEQADAMVSTMQTMGQSGELDAAATNSSSTHPEMSAGQMPMDQAEGM